MATSHYGLSIACLLLLVRSSSGKSLHCTWSLVPAPSLGCSGPCELVLSSSPDWLAAYSLRPYAPSTIHPVLPSVPGSWQACPFPRAFHPVPTAAPPLWPAPAHFPSLNISITSLESLVRPPPPPPAPAPAWSRQTPCCMAPEPLALTCAPQAHLR